MINEIKCDVCKKVWYSTGDFSSAMEECPIWDHECFKKSKIKTNSNGVEKND